MNRYILKNNEPIEFYQNGPHIHDRIEFLEWVESHFDVVYKPDIDEWLRNPIYISHTGHVHYYHDKVKGWVAIEQGAYCGIDSDGDILVINKDEFRDKYRPYDGDRDEFENIDVSLYHPHYFITKDGKVEPVAIREHRDYHHRNSGSVDLSDYDETLIDEDTARTVLNIRPLPGEIKTSWIDTDPVHISYVENFESLVSLDGFSGIDDKFNSFVVYDEDRKCFHSSTHTLFTCTGETWGDIVLDIFTAVKPRFKIYIRG